MRIQGRKAGLGRGSALCKDRVPQSLLEPVMVSEHASLHVKVLAVDGVPEEETLVLERTASFLRGKEEIVSRREVG